MADSEPGSLLDYLHSGSACLDVEDTLALTALAIDTRASTKVSAELGLGSGARPNAGHEDLRAGLERFLTS